MYYSFLRNYLNDFAVIKSKASPNTAVSFEKVNVTSIDFSEKNIIILCGNGSKSQSRAEYYSYLCRNWIKDPKFKFDVTTYSIYYPNYQPLFNEDPNITLNYKQLADELFSQVIYKNNQVLSVKKIKANLKNTIFFGHSAGGLVMNELMKNFGNMLKNANFSKSEIKEIYESMIFIAYAPYQLVEAPIKSIYVAPIYDSIGSAKLIYKRILKNKNVTSSIPQLNIFETSKITSRTTTNFIKKYTEKIGERNTLYFLDENSLMSTPNLLYFDGRKEDHNFAGAICYNQHNPHQTKSGKLTSKFLQNVFDYCLTTEREDFNLLELYQETIQAEKKDKVPHLIK